MQTVLNATLAASMTPATIHAMNVRRLTEGSSVSKSTNAVKLIDFAVNQGLIETSQVQGQLRVRSNGAAIVAVQAVKTWNALDAATQVRISKAFDQAMLDGLQVRNASGIVLPNVDQA